MAQQRLTNLPTIVIEPETLDPIDTSQIIYNR